VASVDIFGSYTTQCQERFQNLHEVFLQHRLFWNIVLENLLVCGHRINEVTTATLGPLHLVRPPKSKPSTLLKITRTSRPRLAPVDFLRTHSNTQALKYPKTNQE
jgi:hypothetical protein